MTATNEYIPCGRVVERDYGLRPIVCERPRGHAVDNRAYQLGCGERRIIRNSAKCNSCGDEIESTHRHDYRTCKCGNAMVDGGRAYLRHGCRDGWESVTDTSTYEV